MSANYFIKPLQGRILNLLGKIIMVWRYVSNIENLLPTPSKEHVGKMDDFRKREFVIKNKSYVDSLIKK